MTLALSRSGELLGNFLSSVVIELTIKKLLGNTTCSMAARDVHIKQYSTHPSAPVPSRRAYLSNWAGHTIAHLLSAHLTAHLQHSLSLSRLFHSYATTEGRRSFTCLIRSSADVVAVALRVV